MLSPAYAQLREAVDRMPFFISIESDADYELALEAMESLIDEDDTDHPLFDLLVQNISKWEDSADEFKEFNAAVSSMDKGAAVLRTLMAQHGLGVADLPELGSKSTVSKLINTAEGKQLSRKHIQALSERFGVSPAIFF